MKRFFIIISVLIMMLSLVSAVNVDIDGVELHGARLVGSVTYVPVRTFVGFFDDFDVNWHEQTKTAELTSDKVALSVRIGDKYVESAGRAIYSGQINLLIEGKTYVPVRSLAKVMSADVEWNNETRSVSILKNGEKFVSADEYYNEADLYWLAKIINAESEGEPLDGKIAVGNVVLNRVENDEFPNTVYDVIFDKKGGVQFTPVSNGTINKEPGAESILAAKICLEDYRMADRDILFFLNPTISTSTWVPDNRDFVMTIGKHDFYA